MHFTAAAAPFPLHLSPFASRERKLLHNAHSGRHRGGQRASKWKGTENLPAWGVFLDPTGDQSTLSPFLGGWVAQMGTVYVAARGGQV